MKNIDFNQLSISPNTLENAEKKLKEFGIVILEGRSNIIENFTGHFLEGGLKKGGGFHKEIADYNFIIDPVRINKEYGLSFEEVDSLLVQFLEKRNTLNPN